MEVPKSLMTEKKSKEDEQISAGLS